MIHNPGAALSVPRYWPSGKRHLRISSADLPMRHNLASSSSRLSSVSSQCDFSCSFALLHSDWFSAMVPSRRAWEEKTSQVTGIPAVTATRPSNICPAKADAGQRHGHGRTSKRYREEQEDQLGALGLVTNADVLWNTLYMQEALSCMRSNGEETNDEGIARLSPLMHGHINMLGHYTFTLSTDWTHVRVEGTRTKAGVNHPAFFHFSTRWTQ